MTEFGVMAASQNAWATLGALESFTRDTRGIVGDLGGPQLAVTVLAPNLVRVRLAPAGAFLPRRSWAVTRDDGEWPVVPFDLSESATEITIETGQMRVQIARNPCRITCYDKTGQPFAEDDGPGMTWRAGRMAAFKRIADGEHYYGFGERTGLLDKRGEVKTNWARDAVDFSTRTDNMYQAIPVFLALRPGLGYGIFFNTSYWSRFDMGVADPGYWSMETAGPELDYYIIYGPTPPAILETYTALTGRMPLPPRWALGYHQCRWSYFPASVVQELAQQFRVRRIPCDVIHLDIDYMAGFRVFTWSPVRFPQPEKLVGELGQA